MARLLWDSAAKWTTVSMLVSSMVPLGRRPRSQMSPWTKAIRSSTSARLGRFPA